jgi:hypothetical protein
MGGVREIKANLIQPLFWKLERQERDGLTQKVCQINRSLGGRTRDGDWCRIKVVRFGGETVENVGTGSELAHAHINKKMH